MADHVSPDTSEAHQPTSPPYIPFKTFLNLILRMEEGAPPRLDRSYLASQAGGLHQPIIAAFRYFGLIGPANEVLPELEELAQSGDALPQRVGALIRGRYAWAHLGSTNATQQMLDDAFRAQGLSGSTLRKAVTFYLHASRYSDLPLSRFYKVARGVSQNGTAPAPTRPRRRTAGRRQGEAQPPAPQVREQTQSHDADEVRKNKYFDLLLELAAANQENQEVQADLLNRIEKLIPSKLGG
jgi:hypothetical protein